MNNYRLERVKRNDLDCLHVMIESNSLIQIADTFIPFDDLRTAMREPEQLVSILQPYLHDLYDAGMEIEQVLEEGYAMAQDLVGRDCANNQRSTDTIHTCPQAASLLKRASEEVGISRKQQNFSRPQRARGYEGTPS